MSGYHDSYGGSGGGGYHHHGGYSNPNNAVNTGTGNSGAGAATNNYNPSGDVVYPSYYGYEDDDYPSSDSSSSEGNILDVEETEADDEEDENVVDFDDPSIADLPRILLMGPRRAGKTSIQVRMLWNHNIMDSKLLLLLLFFFMFKWITMSHFIIS